MCDLGSQTEHAGQSIDSKLEDVESKLCKQQDGEGVPGQQANYGWVRLLRIEKTRILLGYVSKKNGFLI